MEKKGTLRQKRRPKGDPNPQKGPLGDPGPLKGTQLGTVRQRRLCTKRSLLHSVSSLSPEKVKVAGIEELSKSSHARNPQTVSGFPVCGLLVGHNLVLNFLVWKHDCVCLSYVRICLSAFDSYFHPTFDFARCDFDREKTWIYSWTRNATQSHLMRST